MITYHYLNGRLGYDDSKRKFVSKTWYPIYPSYSYLRVSPSIHLDLTLCAKLDDTLEAIVAAEEPGNKKRVAPPGREGVAGGIDSNQYSVLHNLAWGHAFR